VSVQKHESAEDYSSWLLPAVERGLSAAGVILRDVEVLAVASGPGSFTGLRVGLTAVKAWAELFGLKVVGVSRLEVMARGLSGTSGFVAASFDAQRGQMFGGLYKCEGERGWSLIEDEMVIAPDEFVKWVGQHANGDGVRWITLDTELIAEVPSWKERAAPRRSADSLCGWVGGGNSGDGEERARMGKFTDPLVLDANYVRRIGRGDFLEGSGAPWEVKERRDLVL